MFEMLSMEDEEWQDGLESKEGRINVEFEIKELTEEGTFKGYASVFNNVDSDRDIIVPGAFAESLKKKGVKGIRLLWMHDSRQPIGTITVLQEDKTGLYFEAKLVLTVQKGLEAYELLKAKAIDRMSIGFTIPDRENDIEVSRDRMKRKIKNVDLWEISIVTFPANQRAKIQAVKSESGSVVGKVTVDKLDSVRSVENYLRDVGFSRSIAKAMSSKWNSQRDVEESDNDQRDAGIKGMLANIKKASDSMITKR